MKLKDIIKISLFIIFGVLFLIVTIHIFILGFTVGIDMTELRFFIEYKELYLKWFILLFLVSFLGGRIKWH